MHPAPHDVRIFFVALLIACCPALARSEPFQTVNDPATGISVMVPDGYSASISTTSKGHARVILTSNDPIGGYCDLSFGRTPVPDKWWRDKAKRDLNDQLRTREIKEVDGQCIPNPTLRSCQNAIPTVIDGKIVRLSPNGLPPVQTRSLDGTFRALFIEISVRCTARAEEYEVRRPVFLAVIRSIKVPH